VVKLWLRYARDRSGGRQGRLMKQQLPQQRLQRGIAANARFSSVESE